MPKLLDHHQFPVGSDGDDINPIHTVDHKKIVWLFGPWRNLMVGADAEDPKIPHRFRSNLRPGLNHGAACVAALLLGMFLFLVIETATAGQFPSSKASLFGSPSLLHELEQMDEGLLR